MTIFDDFHGRVAAALGRLADEGLLPAALDLSRLAVEPPRDAAMGDLSTNAAMVLARDAGLQPRVLADRLAGLLRGEPGIATVSVAGPGFVNVTLHPSVLLETLSAIVVEGRDFAKRAPRTTDPVNVEYVSANPTGPLHVGHGRGAVFGDSLANLLVFAGQPVVREYYVNDAGAQVDVLGRSAFLRYREALGETIGTIPDGLYPGAYLVPVGAMLAATHGDALLSMDEPEWLPIVRDVAIDGMMALIREDLAALDIRHDVFFSERSLRSSSHDAIAAVIERLQTDGVVYSGVLPPPKGAPGEDYEEREQLLFRTTSFGDDVDRPLRKSDGSHTYFAADIAYHASKYERGFARMIDVWGADHGGYVKRMQAAVSAVTGKRATLDVKLCQLVKLMRDGEQVKMSKRSGDFVTLREIVEEVGRDAVRFMMLMRKNDAPLDFDLAKVIEQSKENPVFYVQYAHARCASIFRQAHETMGITKVGVEAAVVSGSIVLGDVIGDPAEMDVVRRLALFPRLVEQAALAHEPHRIAFYLHDLAASFHSLWNRGSEVPQLRFVNATDEKSTTSRLALVLAVKTVVASGLSILGVTAPEEMR